VKSVNCQTQVTLTPPPYQKCVALNSDVLDEQQRQVEFTVTTDQGNGSTLKSADFDFGDGTMNSNVSPASSSTVVDNHTYAAAGTYNITATVHFNTPGGEKSVNCATSVTFAPTPAPTCDGLTLSKLGGREIEVQVAYTADGATLQSVTYNFGDGSQPVTTSNTTETYTYAQDGDYNVTAALTFLVDGQAKVVSSDSCAQAVSFTTPPPTCTAPNGKTYPKGSPECEVCQYNSKLPANSPECKAPTCTAPNGQTYPMGSKQCTPTCTSPTSGQTYPMGSSECLAKPTSLVNTGPGSVIGLFAGASIVGTTIYRMILGRRFARR
jgi:PKD domain